MKKRMIIMATICLLATATVNLTAPITASAARQVSYAAYVKKELKPIIDGEIDEIWNDYGIKYKTNETAGVGGYSSVLWDETGYYFLAYVEDSTINESDACSFWVSEDYYTNQLFAEWYNDQGTAHYSTDGKDGTYYITVNAKGDISVSFGVENFKGQVGVEINEEYGYYVVEVYSPLMCDDFKLQDESRLGFEFTVDDYTSTDVFASTVKWGKLRWAYWDNPTTLGKIKLVKSEEDIRDTALENDEPVSCASSAPVGVLLCGGIACLAVCFLKKGKKKNEIDIK